LLLLPQSQYLTSWVRSDGSFIIFWSLALKVKPTCHDWGLKRPPTCPLHWPTTWSQQQNEKWCCLAPLNESKIYWDPCVHSCSTSLEWGLCLAELGRDRGGMFLAQIPHFCFPHWIFIDFSWINISSFAYAFTL
jgi:hypothetical protein